MFGRRFYLLLGLSFIVFFNQSVLGQTTTATILGAVKDDTGAVLPGVLVVVKHLDTGRTRTIITDDEGRYRAPNLAVGSYEVQAELAGFQTTIRRGVTLTVGQEAIVDLNLKVGRITEQVVVTGEVPLVETRTATVTALVDDKKIRDLPLNARDFSQLAMLQSGVYAPPSMGQAIDSIAGAGPKISISGARPNQNNFLLDGADVQDAVGRTPAGVSGITLGVETVREFTVLTSIYSAEYGKVAGGVINAVTKSGTNELHGSIFEFLRNDNLDARNFFDLRKPEFKRNQFGFTLGGPVIKDRTFFFGSYEGLRDRLGLTKIATVLTADARQGNFPDGTVIPVSPRVTPYLENTALNPLPNGRDFRDGRGEFIFSVNQPTSENYFLIKVDHNFSDAHSIFIRYNLDDSKIITHNRLPAFQEVGKTDRQFTTIEDKIVISPTLLNEARFSFNRNIFGVISEQTISLPPSLSFVPGRPLGDLSIGGLSALGYFPFQDRVLTQNMFEYIDNVTYNHKKHSMRFGTQVKRIQFNTFSAFAQNARWIFGSVGDFLRARPFQLDLMLPGSDTVRGWRQVYFGAYVQDDMQLTPTFTVSLGIRYELSTEPREVNGKVANLVNPLTDRETSVLDTLYKNPCLKCFAPRVGFAWDVFRNKKTALRGGFGIFNNVLLPTDWIFHATNAPPFFKRPLLFNPPGFPSVPEALASVSIPPFGFQTTDATPNQPYLIKYNLNIQRELLPNLVLKIGYIGSRGVHWGRIQTQNINQFEVLPDGRKFFPVGAPRFNPAFSAIAMGVFDAKTTYNALQFSVNRRFSRGFQFQLDYTFSKTMDETSGHGAGLSESPGTTTSSMDPYDRGRDYALSGFHVHNAATLNFSYDVPIKAAGALNKLVTGWQVNGILSLADGNPVNIQNTFDRARSGNAPPGSGLPERPNLRLGGNSNPYRHRNPDRYWDGTQFELQDAGFFGNLGRDTGIIPGVANFDFSLNKNVSFGEQRVLQFRFEFFNILNRANFGVPDRNVFVDASGIPSRTFGRITSTTTTARQIQFGLKFLF
ncbi:MAG: TonB-dependent receptor [Acidobacteria bacterium]|nr:TonB-dependent receptor [Acidobacteriota bacterium]